ncbi:MAG: TA system VapC family ribonuclease toxin [Candidatus Velthaea sp.]|jgi:toxin-antitoxin system PIN domain toxin
MKIVDVNLLIYAYNNADPLHGRACRWLTAAFNGPERIGIALSTALAYVRITTNVRIFPQPLSVADACTVVQEWLACDNVVLLAPTERHWELFRQLAIAAQARGPLAPDADLAASAIEHGATLCTHDRDYSRFEGVRIEFPLS